jgi:outer membrane lipoprotein-sorting protein
MQQLRNNRWLFFIPVVLCGMTVQAQDAAALVKKVKTKLETVSNYEAIGVMKTNVSFIKVPDSKITVYYKKPDKFRIKKENGISIMPKGSVSLNQGTLLAGDNYTTVAAGTGKVGDKAVTIVKLLPLDEKSEVVVSTLYIDEQEAVIRKAVTTTRNNGTYEIEMIYGKFIAWGLPDKVAFIFNTKDYKLPKGLAFDYDTGEKPAAASADKDQKGKVEITYTSYNINKGISDNIFQ